jgi:hypothetical protein
LIVVQRVWITMSNNWSCGITLSLAPLAEERGIEEGILVDESLTEKEMAMLEMIEFGIDLWSSTEGRDIAFALRDRGLIRIEESIDGPACLRCCITAEGSAVLETMKGMPIRPLRRGVKQAG